MLRPSKRLRRPLSGLIICSEPASTTLKSKTEALGATYITQLTPETTHFLAAVAGTEAHRKAQTQKTQIVYPSWLHACHAATLLLPTSTHALPPLSGLTISCSGLDAQEKAHIESLCRDTGAHYSRTLGRNCTHLLCDTPSGRKYEFAKGSGSIKIVRSRWLKECAQGNVLLDETPFYLPITPSNTATVTASGTEVAPSAVPGTQPSQQTQERAKADNTLLDGAVLYLPPSRVSDRAKHAPLHAKALRLAAKTGATVSSMLSPLVTHIIILRSPVTASVQRAIKTSSAIVTALSWLEDVAEKGRIPEAYEYKYAPPEKMKSEKPKLESNVFLGVRACVGPLALRDATAAGNVENVLISGRGKVLPHDSSGQVTSGVATHVVFPTDMKVSDRIVLDYAKEENGNVVAVTAFWVEMSHSAEKLLPTSWCMLFRPLEYTVPVQGMIGLEITISGFQKGSEWDYRREVLKRVAILLGCKYSDRMRRKATRVLVAEKDGSDKVKKAREWGIEVVQGGWLHECVKTGRLVEFAEWSLYDDGDGRGKDEGVDDAAIQVFERFKHGIEASGGVVEERRRVRSRSVSRDEWSMDASQSQVIVHRDLTPPASQAG